MGLTKKEKITYLKIADGRLRLKTNKDDPQAEERYVEINDKFLYERVFTTCEGFVRGIMVQEHEEYGVSYSLVLYDPATKEKFSLQMGEASRYFASLVMHLPSVDFGKPLEVRPYSFKQDGRSSIGLMFKQNGEKVPNHYKDYDKASNTSTPKNGLEAFDFRAVKDDKEERKILQIQLLKFFKKELKPQVERLLEYVEQNPLPTTEDGEVAGPSTKEEAGHDARFSDSVDEATAAEERGAATSGPSRRPAVPTGKGKPNLKGKGKQTPAKENGKR